MRPIVAICVGDSFRLVHFYAALRSDPLEHSKRQNAVPELHACYLRSYFMG